MKTTSYLYEGLDNKSKKSMMLWESAGRAISEAQLTPQQITQLFQQVEKDATAAGDNRTLIGKGKDAASSVSQAYQDLKSKVENSAIMQNFDQAYDQAAEKLKQATGGDQGVMTYVQKYRDFAKKHPIAQSLIYGALIAAAGISGAGAGGAAALGLLKMTDKLLQGEKFSSAAIAGAETGALAYGASKVGDMMRGGDTTTTTTNYQSSTVGMQPANPWDIPNAWKQKYPVDQFVYKSDGMDYFEVFDQAGRKVANFDTSGIMESFVLNESQVSALFGHVIIAEGLWDSFKTKVLGIGAEPEVDKATGQMIKQGAKRAAGWAGKQAQRIGHNITTKTTADKLQKAWKSAGSPTDSEAIKDVLTAQGIAAEVIDNSFKALKIATTDRSKIPDISQLSKQQLQQLLQMLEQATKAHTGGKIAGQVSQTPNAIRQRQSRAAKKVAPSTTPVQTATQTTTTTQPQQQSMSQILKQRQAQGLGAYESVEFSDLKTKLKEALTK